MTNIQYLKIVKIKKKLKNIDTFSKTVVSIPCGWWVNKSQIDYIIWAIKRGGKFKKKKFYFLLIESGH